MRITKKIVLASLIIFILIVGYIFIFGALVNPSPTNSNQSLIVKKDDKPNLVLIPADNQTNSSINQSVQTPSPPVATPKAAPKPPVVTAAS